MSILINLTISINRKIKQKIKFILDTFSKDQATYILLIQKQNRGTFFFMKALFQFECLSKETKQKVKAINVLHKVIMSLLTGLVYQKN